MFPGRTTESLMSRSEPRVIWIQAGKFPIESLGVEVIEGSTGLIRDPDVWNKFTKATAGTRASASWCIGLASGGPRPIDNRTWKARALSGYVFNEAADQMRAELDHVPS